MKRARITIEIDTRGMSATEIGTLVHQEIERVMTGHYIVGDSHIGLRLSPRQAPLFSIMIAQGGVLHEIQMHGTEFDLSEARKIIRDVTDAIVGNRVPPSMSVDPRRDPLTGRIRKTVNDEDPI